MIKKILNNKKYRDYYNFSNCECRVAIIITVMIFILLVNPRVDIYINFNKYKEVLQNIIIYLAAGLLAMIGVILTAIAFILDILDKKHQNRIRFIFLSFRLNILY